METISQKLVFEPSETQLSFHQQKEVTKLELTVLNLNLHILKDN